jgi:arginase family enzyme
VEHFRTKVVNHFFRNPSFFNVPDQIDDADALVGLVGVPVSANLESIGTENAPNQLRRDSQRLFWFDVHDKGVYSEIGCDDSPPGLLCHGTVLKDFGDVGRDARTVGDLFGRLRELVHERLLPNGVRPVFVGGDHAVTFPIVDAYLAARPDLCLLHLDAHNDLFYTDHVDYSHAGPIRSLLLHSDLRQVFSFGLRTVGDPRVEPFTRVLARPELRERIHLYSLGAVGRWLARPEELRAHLRERVAPGVPCYLSIDLDVLSAEAISGALSTPAESGLEWQELYELVDVFFDTLDVIACDVVEFNTDNKDRQAREGRYLQVLLLLLLDRLTRTGRASRPSEG